MRLCFPQLKAWVYRTFHCRCLVCNYKSELMNRLSHELRTSLTGIVGYSEFVESSSTEPMVNFTAKIIRESSQDLARASNSFFDLNRLESGEIYLNCTEFSINELVRSVVKIYQRQAIERNVNIFSTCSAESSSLDVYADFQRVGQVIDALVFDAVKVAEKGMSVHVDVSLDDEKRFVKLMIIFLNLSADGFQLKLLKEFWCDENYKFRLQEGPGVELALAKALIYHMHGDVDYHSSSDELPRLIVSLPIRYGSQFRRLSKVLL